MANSFKFCWALTYPSLGSKSCILNRGKVDFYITYFTHLFICAILVTQMVKNPSVMQNI